MFVLFNSDKENKEEFQLRNEQGDRIWEGGREGERGGKGGRERERGGGGEWTERGGGKIERERERERERNRRVRWTEEYNSIKK